MLPFVPIIPGCDLPFPPLEVVGGDGKADEGLFLWRLFSAQLPAAPLPEHPQKSTWGSAGRAALRCPEFV